MGTYVRCSICVFTSLKLHIRELIFGTHAHTINLFLVW